MCVQLSGFRFLFYKISNQFLRTLQASFVQKEVAQERKLHKAPLCKGSSRAAGEGLSYYHFAGYTNRQYVQTIPPTRLRRATSFCTKEAFKVWWSFRRSTPLCWGEAQAFREQTIPQSLSRQFPLHKGAFLLVSCDIVPFFLTQVCIDYADKI